ncbi:hypothetical protein CBF16_13315 [Pantoea agglomerans]|uniref:hypothetical protein n=1 Tax=Enterobacter agglomerans TaxID=549 RepID=UPI000F5E4003|nr:hypothetical protein [Pantoea agglomerans]AZI51789.1 hypothetical protein CBF16_13315 [Pantoea agglomerans]
MFSKSVKNKAREKAKKIFIAQTGYSGPTDNLECKEKKIIKFFTKSSYLIKVKGNVNGQLVESEIIIVDDEYFLENITFQLYIFVYSLIIFLLVLGIRNNWRFYEIIFFSPMLFGFLVFKCCRKPLGDNLKKIADTLSFFLGTLTACSISFKSLGIKVKTFQFLPDWLTLSATYVAINILCIFITVKFLISLFDLLSSIERKEDSILSKILRKLS